MLIRFGRSSANPSPFVSRAFGVGQFTARYFNDGMSRFASPAIPPIISLALGVGHEPEPLTLVRGTNGGCGEQTPFRIEPERGKVSEDMG